MAYGRPLAVRAGMGRPSRRRPSESFATPSSSVASGPVSLALQYSRVLSAGFSAQIDLPAGSGTDNPDPSFRYVGPTAAGNGNGTSWANRAQWSTVAFQRGLTYYLMDGSYGAGRNLSTTPAGTTPITIKKATALDHGMDAGFSASTMGSGQALFTSGFNFATSNWIIDGTTGGGPGQWETNFGIFINMQSGSAQSNCFSFGSNVANITVRHVDVYGRGRTNVGETDIFYIVAPVTNLLVEYCFLRESSRTMILTWPAGCNGITLQYNKFARNGNAEHREAWSAGPDANVVVRYNLFEDIMGTGMIAIVNNTGNATNWDIYGNVFYWTGNYTDGIINTGILVARYDTTGTISVRVLAQNWRIYNNVIANVRNGSFTSAFNLQGPITGCEARNNIWFNNQGSAGAGAVNTKSHNWFYNNTGGNDASGTSDIVGTSNPFVDATPWTTGNWALKASIPGFALASPYNTDMLGNTRGAGGTSFDRGAIEYTAG